MESKRKERRGGEEGRLRGHGAEKERNQTVLTYFTETSSERMVLMNPKHCRVTSRSECKQD